MSKECVLRLRVIAWTWRSLIAFFLVSLVACAPRGDQALGGGAADSPTVVDVGARRLEVRRAGQGKPTVVFESGFIAGFKVMKSLQDNIAKHTSTVAYSRAGLGASEPGPEPRTASQITQELRSLLENLGISEPVIIVGHSAGGMFARVFTNRFPDRVAGLVLVDPATEEGYEHWRTTDPVHWAGFEEEVRHKYDPPSGWYGQWRALPRSIDEARAAWPLPSVPIVVFTALVPTPEEWILANDARIQVWLKGHRNVVARIPQAKHIVVESADHMSILNNDDLKRSILETVEAVRAAR